MKNVLPVLLKDGYKADHKRQYPKGTSLVYSNWTPRSSRDDSIDEVVCFGLQYFIIEYLMRQFKENFFEVDKADVLRLYKRRMDNYLGPDAFPIDHIGELHDLGYLPLRIKALPEGTLCPLKVPMITVENTVPEFFWLTNMLETIMSSILWKPCTSATIGLQYRRDFEKYCKLTGGTPEGIQFQAHDFSFRGMPGLECACLSGAAHLLSFVGTDTIPAIDFLEDYYGADSDNELVGCSVAATEHSVQCLNALQDSGEPDDGVYVDRMLDLYPTGIVSIVSDGFDFWKMLTEVIPARKERIMARDGKVVIRPDSGDPVKIILGDDESTEKHVYEGAIKTLWNTFGGTETSTGHNTLDSHIGLIYGDAITRQRQQQILHGLYQRGFSSDNIVLGVGSFTYQLNTRDNFGFAMKATYGEVNGEGRPIYKDPKTDRGLKKSARGLLSVGYTQDGRFVLADNCDRELEDLSALETVFLDGELVKFDTLSDIRKRLSSNF